MEVSFRHFAVRGKARKDPSSSRGCVIYSNSSPHTVVVAEQSHSYEATLLNEAGVLVLEVHCLTRPGLPQRFPFKNPRCYRTGDDSQGSIVMEDHENRR